jgi:hypothetical protein
MVPIAGAALAAVLAFRETYLLGLSHLPAAIGKRHKVDGSWAS